jgi:uncharacterized protein (DUF427 family)
MRRPLRIEPGPGQESVWDYPRGRRPWSLAPRLVEVRFGDRLIASTTGSFRVLETSHPPTFYLPPDDITPGSLRPAGGGSVCEWKGRASYWDVIIGDSSSGAPPGPTRSRPRLRAIAGFVSFYPAMVDCTVGGVVVEPQPGGFYGGWITPEVVGPFKGEPGTTWW